MTRMLAWLASVSSIRAVRIKTVFFLESRSNNNNNNNSDSSMAVNCDTENWCDLHRYDDGKMETSTTSQNLEATATG